MSKATAVLEKPATADIAMDDEWGFLEESPAEFAPRGTRAGFVDVNKEVPESLRRLFTHSLRDYSVEMEVPGGVVPENQPKWRFQSCPTEAQARKFVEKGKLWAKHRLDENGAPAQVSFRAALVVKENEPVRIKFAVMELGRNETRNVNGSGTASNPDNAKIRAWGKEKGLISADHGRISKEVRDAYYAEQGLTVVTA
jgi:hypothetical protein